MAQLRELATNRPVPVLLGLLLYLRDGGSRFLQKLVIDQIYGVTSQKLITAVLVTYPIQAEVYLFFAKDIIASLKFLLIQKKSEFTHVIK
jgi:hypothetical protein